MSGTQTTTPPSYTSTLNGYRIADLIQGDTIEQVALRTMGDASKWRVLVNLNGLQWPYLTDNPACASSTVLLTGGTIMVPAAKAAAPSAVVDDTLFGTDLQLVGGQLQISNGDFAVVSGLENLKCALLRRLKVICGELPYWPTYGSLISTLIGKGATPADNALAAAYAARAVKADPRIDSVSNAVAVLTGDNATVSMNAMTTDGKVLPTGNVYVSN